jgi:hypothetical protein
MISLLVCIYMSGKMRGKIEMCDEMLEWIQKDFEEQNQELLKGIREKRAGQSK